MNRTDVSIRELTRVGVGYEALIWFWIFDSGWTWISWIQRADVSKNGRTLFTEDGYLRLGNTAHITRAGTLSRNFRLTCGF